jgi:hypothetical protein
MKLRNIILSLSIASMAFLASCGDSSSSSPKPTISLKSVSNYNSTTGTVNMGSVLTFNVIATAGSDAMKNIVITAKLANGSTKTLLDTALITKNIDFTKTVTAGAALINNILCAAFSFTYNDPLSSPRQIQCVFFEKKWFVTSQGSLTYITSVPLAGLINLYGTTGTDLLRLYSNTSGNVASTIRTALMPMGDSIRTKQALKFGIEATLSNVAVLNVTVDSETGSSPTYTLDNSVIWYNNSQATIGWQNNSNVTIGWLSSNGYALYKSDAQQYGKYLGLTLTSNSAGFIVNTFEFEHELRVRF